MLVAVYWKDPPFPTTVTHVLRISRSLVSHLVNFVVAMCASFPSFIPHSIFHMTFQVVVFSAWKTRQAAEKEINFERILESPEVMHRTNVFDADSAAALFPTRTL